MMNDRSLELLKEGIKEHVPPEVQVDVVRDIRSPNILVRFYDRKANIAMDEFVCPELVHEFVESDGKGWDAYGVHGLDAMLLTIGMSLDPQYADKPHRIPPPESGLRLSVDGDRFCFDLARLFSHERKKLLCDE